MKKYLSLLFAISVSCAALKAQCVANCSSYTVAAINYSLFPNTGVDIVSSLAPNTDDGYTPPIPLGFNFTYYCTTYSTVLICSNGFLVFAPATPTINGADAAQSLPSSTTPNGLVCLNMNDFDVGAGGSITYTTIGAAPNRMFVVTYSTVPIWYNSATNTPSVPVYNSGQIVLYEGSNDIEIHSASIGLSPNLMTQGIENENGTIGVPVPGRNNSYWSTTNTAYRWQNTLMGLPLTGLTGTTTACVNDIISYSVNANTAVSSYNWAFPPNWSGASSSGANTVTLSATASGNVSVTASYSACGSSTPISIYVAVNPLPVISVSNVTPALVCSGNIIIVTPIGAATYTILPGGPDGTPPFNFTVAANTTYSVAGTSASGCVSQAATVVPVIIEPTPTVTVNSGSICLGETFTLNPNGAAQYSFSTLFSQVTPTGVGVYTYFVTGATASGFCTAQAGSNLTVNPVPSLNIVASKPIACLNETVSLTGQGATTYNWLNNNSTNTVNTITVTASIEYTLTGKNNFGCGAEMKKFISLSPCTGIDELSGWDDELLLYPNPSQGEFNFTSEQPLFIIVSDVNGKEVYRKRWDAGNIKIDINDQAGGVYLLRTISDDGLRKAVLIKN